MKISANWITSPKDPCAAAYTFKKSYKAKKYSQRRLVLGIIRPKVIILAHNVVKTA